MDPAHWTVKDCVRSHLRCACPHSLGSLLALVVPAHFSAKRKLRSQLRCACPLCRGSVPGPG